MFFCQNRARALVCWSLLVFAGPWCSVSGQTNGETVNATDQEKAKQAVRDRLDNTRKLLEKGSDSEAEALLAADAKNIPQSADWYQEQAADFMRVAIATRASGDVETSQRAARLALAQLDKAEALAVGDADTLSGIYELRGYIREKLWGDSEQAKQAYGKALEQNPNSKSVRQKLHRADLASAVSEETNTRQ